MTISTRTSSKNRIIAVLQYILAFVIPLIIIILVYIGLHITPFGDKTIIISDAKALYMSDLSFIQRALRGQENLLYSFQQGIGLNMMGTHSGLLNPANIIVLLFDITGFPAMYSWLMAIDMAMCGLTMFIFLSTSYGRKNYNLIFSTLYALNGFNTAYCFHYNFLLSVELFPLIALGIRKIIKGKSPWLYLITLAYAILASFYFGYMVCIASLVFFLMWYAEEKRQFVHSQNKRVCINFFGASIIAGLLPAFIWIATFLSFSGGRAEQNSIFDFTMEENMSFADAFAKLFIGSNNTNELVNGQPNIFVGALVVFLVIAFFVDTNNTKRAKIVHVVPLTFYFITFYVRALSMMMQGFTATNWFNYRYSFVLCFMLILTAFEEYMKIREMDANEFKRTCIIFGVFVVVVFSQRFSFVSGAWMVVDVLILLGCLGAIWWNRVDENRAPQKVLVMLLVLLCSIECYANYMVSTSNLFDWAYKESEYQKDLFIGSVIADAVTGADPSFYRMVDEHPTNSQCNNDPRLFGYNGVNYFGSCEQTFVFQGMSRLGLPWWANRMWYAEGIPDAFDALLGIKYVASERDLTEEKEYERIGGIEGQNIYRNNNALPIGLMVRRNIGTVTLGRNPFENHNNLWKSMTGGSENVFTQETDLSFTFHANNDGERIDYQEAQQFSTSMSKQIEASTNSGKNDGESTSESGESTSDAEALTVDAIKDSGRYIECTFTAQQDGSIYSYSGAGVQDNYGSSSETIHYLGEFKNGDDVTDYIPVTVETLNFGLMKGLCAEYYVAYANNDVLESYCKQLVDTTDEIVNETNSLLVGSVNAKEGERLFFTIPYDEGWALKVDGVETELKKTADLFMSAKVSPGTHSYELSFFPKGMSLGFKVSSGAVVLLLLLICYNVLNQNSKTKNTGEMEEDEEEESCMIEIEEHYIIVENDDMGDN